MSYTPSSFSRINEFSINLIDDKAIIIQKNPDKIIFSSNKISFINNLIKYGLKKMKINIKIENKIKKKESKKLIGNNSFAKRLLKWKNKKNIYLAFEEILQKR